MLLSLHTPSPPSPPTPPRLGCSVRRTHHSPPGRCFLAREDPWPKSDRGTRRPPPPPPSDSTSVPCSLSAQASTLPAPRTFRGQTACFPSAPPAHLHSHLGRASQLKGGPRAPASPRAAHSRLGSPPRGAPRAVRTPSQPPRPRRPGRSPHGPGPASRPSAAPHLRVRTVGLYLPLFLFLKSEFMVAAGRGGGSLRRAGHGAAEAPARTEGRAACAGERAATREPRVRRGGGGPSLLAGGGAPAGRGCPRRSREGGAYLPGGGAPGGGAPGGGASRRSLGPAGASWAPSLESGWGHGVLGGPGPSHPTSQRGRSRSWAGGRRRTGGSSERAPRPPRP